MHRNGCMHHTVHVMIRQSDKQMRKRRKGTIEEVPVEVARLHTVLFKMQGQRCGVF